MTLRPLFAALLLVALVAPAVHVSPVDAATAPYIVMLDEATAGGLSADELTVRGSAAVIGTTADDDDTDVRLRMDPRRVGHKIAQLEIRHGLKATNVFGALGGFSANLSTAQRNALAADPTVASVGPDAPISLDESEVVGSSVAAVRTTTSSTPNQPSGIARVGATKSAVASINGLDQRVNVDVAVLDTGVDAAHPDLNVAGGYNCTSTNRSAWKDKHGHGTHVAGTIGAIDNSIGVVGVAPGARIWSVKVLGDNGSGYASWLVCGINWVTSQIDPAVPSRLRIEVANMSLLFNLPNYDDRNCGIPANDSVHMAICRSVDAGVVYAVAAGNESKNARMYRPAAYDEVITVSAIVDYDGKPGGLARQADYCPFYSADPDDTFAKFSNFGADVDLTAPGKCVLSTYPGNRYAWMSGTSMATPHVAGAAALYLATYPGARPQQVRMALQHSGRLDWKTETDRDNRHEKLVWVGSFSPPPFFTMSSGNPSGYLSTGRNITLPITLSRSNGHTAPITMSLVNAPAGVTLTGSAIKGNSGTVTLRVAVGSGAGTFSAKLRASDGELSRGRQISLLVDAELPVGSFNSPRSGTETTQNSTSLTVSWLETDIGSGVASRALQRQRAVPVLPGSCTAAVWSNDGSARTSKTNFTETLRNGYCYRWRLTLRDNAQNVSYSTSGTVLVGPSAPILPSLNVSAPVTTIASGVKVTTSGMVRMDVAWTVEAVTSSVVRNELRLSSNGGTTWSALSLPNVLLPRAAVALPAGGTFVLAARAQDADGTWSPWTAGAPFVVRLSEAEGNTLSYTGSWVTATVSGVSGGQLRYSSEGGATARFAFTGRSVAVVGWTGPSRGQAKIFLDGTRVAVIDLNAATITPRRVVFSRSWTSVQPHVLEVRVKGTTGRVDLDAVVVLGAP